MTAAGADASPTRESAWIDRLLALILFGVSLAIYWRTLFPGLGGGGDPAKFQFVGSVLGTPHPPGYPLYIVVSWVFGKIPMGTLAWRINLMSAFFASMAATLAFAVARRIGCRRWVGVAIAFGLAFDDFMWSKAVHAEVYTFGGALVAATILAAVHWGQTRRMRDFYLMVAMFALSLGNHLTAATVLPGIVAYVLLTDWRIVNVRTIVTSFLIVVAGLAQYTFIWIRTVQHAAYLEATAHNLTELISVMRASRFAYQIFAFTPREVILERIPILWHTCVAEFSPLGILFVLGGIAATVVRRLPEGVLLALGASGILFLTLNVAADVEGFLVPAFVMLWILGAIGFEALWRLPGVATKAGTLLMVSLAMALPAAQLARNYRANDHHRRTYEIRYTDALFRTLEDRTVVVSEAYDIDHLLYYKLIGEHAAHGRDISVVQGDPERLRRDVAKGFTVYAFDEGRKLLEGNGFRLAAVTLTEKDGSAIDMSHMPLFRVQKVAGCRDVGNLGWQDISGLPPDDGRLLVRLDDYRPFEATVTLYAGSQTSPDSAPRLASSQGPRAPTMTTESFTGADSAALGAALQRDGVSSSAGLLRQPHVTRIHLSVNDDGQSSWSALDLREKADTLLVKAQVDRDSPKRASVCGWAGQDFFEQADVERIPFGRSGDVLFGMGWHAAERTTGGLEFRWTGAKDAELLVPMSRTGPVVIQIRAMPFNYAGSPQHAMTLVVNGVRQATLPMNLDWQRFEWTLPPSALSKGFNRIVIESSTAASPAALHLSGDTRTLGLAVSEVTLSLPRQAAPR